ncbi:hypothetical protein BDI4_600033 [Burkholderia diffusa]|nr:hypothetical protein BDI4_600033 [Burkholderia diffusa]
MTSRRINSAAVFDLRALSAESLSGGAGYADLRNLNHPLQRLTFSQAGVQKRLDADVVGMGRIADRADGDRCLGLPCDQGHDDQLVVDDALLVRLGHGGLHVGVLGILA